MKRGKSYFLGFGLLFGFQKATAQIPEGVPHPDRNSPIDLSNPADVIIYIVLPVIATILFLIWRRKTLRKD